MKQLFQVGDPVSWPTRDGWHTGVIVQLTPQAIPVQTLTGRTQPANSLRLTIRDAETGRVIHRDIRGCAGRAKGPFLERPSAPVHEPVHDPVTLTAGGAEVWRRVMDPSSAAGKPVRHRPRRMLVMEVGS